MKITRAMLTGRTKDHLVSYTQTYPGLRSEFLLRPKVLEDFLKLKREAKKSGLELALISSFRSYEAQRKIWNEKASGERPLLDDDGSPLIFSELAPHEIIEAIMRWSAIPGASRHHWGTDIDVIDFAGLPTPDYQVSLTSDEVKDSGPFGPLHKWLDRAIATESSYSFYRPYEFDLGGVAPERWHLSHHQSAQQFYARYDLELFRELLNQADFLFARELETNAEALFQRYLQGITPAPWDL